MDRYPPHGPANDRLRIILHHEDTGDFAYPSGQLSFFLEFFSIKKLIASKIRFSFDLIGGVFNPAWSNARMAFFLQEAAQLSSGESGWNSETQLYRCTLGRLFNRFPLSLLHPTE